MASGETSIRDPKLSEKKIYLHEAGEYVGPFCRREDAEKFIALMELFGETREGIEILETDSDWEPQAVLHDAPAHLLCCRK